MKTEFGLTNRPFNTKFAPLAALGLHFQQDGTLKYFDQITSEGGQPDFSPATKLIQVLSSMLAGCEYIYEVNSYLRSEMLLARAWGFKRYLEQSSLAIALRTFPEDSRVANPFGSAGNSCNPRAQLSGSCRCCILCN